MEKRWTESGTSVDQILNRLELMLQIKCTKGCLLTCSGGSKRGGNNALGENLLGEASGIAPLALCR